MRCCCRKAQYLQFGLPELPDYLRHAQSHKFLGICFPPAQKRFPEQRLAAVDHYSEMWSFRSRTESVLHYWNQGSIPPRNVSPLAEKNEIPRQQRETRSLAGPAHPP